MILEKSKNLFLYIFDNQFYQSRQELLEKTKTVFQGYDPDINRATLIEELWKQYPKKVVKNIMPHLIKEVEKNPNHVLCFDAEIRDKNSGHRFGSHFPLFVLMAEYGAFSKNWNKSSIHKYKVENFLILFTQSATQIISPQEIADGWFKGIKERYDEFANPVGTNGINHWYFHKAGYAPPGSWSEWIERFVIQMQKHNKEITSDYIANKPLKILIENATLKLNSSVLQEEPSSVKSITLKKKALL